MSESPETDAESAPAETRPALVVVDGNATAEEVAALVAVLQGMAAAAAAAGSPDEPAPVWAAPSRAVRRTPGSGGGAGVWPGRGAWRSSALPH